MNRLCTPGSAWAGCFLGLAAVLSCSEGGGGGSRSFAGASGASPGSSGSAAGIGSTSFGGRTEGGSSPGMSGAATPVGEGDLGPADYAPGELDAPSDGATITFQQVGATGWYPSRRDPASDMCDVTNADGCCMTQHDVSSNQLTPWNDELSMTLRGPMVVKQVVVYQPGDNRTWARVSAWDSRGKAEGIEFWGSAVQGGFSGRIGSVCEVETAPARPFACGPGSVPYCPAGPDKFYGWAGSKLIVTLAWSPHAGSGVVDDVACDGPGAGWHDAPWIGLSHGELVRSGRYSGCHCWSKPGNPYAQDGCGQFNVFEVVNDNNDFANFDVFSTNLVSYAGYIGEGPCGANCDASTLPASADLLNKQNGGNAAATAGAVSAPGKPTGAAFVRPDRGFRYFITLLDESTRTVQIALVHPNKIPPSIAAVLPNLPLHIPRSAIDAVVGLRLPQ